MVEDVGVIGCYSETKKDLQKQEAASLLYPSLHLRTMGLLCWKNQQMSALSSGVVCQPCFCHKEKALPHVLLMIFTRTCQCSWPHWYKCENSALLQALQAGEPKKKNKMEPTNPNANTFKKLHMSK